MELAWKRRCLLLTALLNFLVIGSFISTFTACLLLSPTEITFWIRILDVVFCCITAGALLVTGREVSTAILATLHRKTPIRVRYRQIRAVKYVSTITLCVRAAMNVLFLSFELTLSSLQERIPSGCWALVVFVFYFLFETVLMLTFLMLIYTQMTQKRSVQKLLVTQSTVSDTSSSTFSVSKVFTCTA